MGIVARFIALLCTGLLAQGAWAVPIGLGSFTFESTLFGDTLVESDSGSHSSRRWLNVANVNPGNPSYLTGANFNTGIGNIGVDGSLAYTIGYGTGILNDAGDDLGVVVARYSSDSFRMAVSSDGGSTFSAGIVISAASAVSSGVGMNYFFGGAGPFAGTLFVHSIDLGLFGIASGSSINAVRISMLVPEGPNELDLIRVAGFAATQAVPEPATISMLGLGLLGAASRRRR